MGLVVKEFNILQRYQRAQVSGLENELVEQARHDAERLRTLVNATFEGILIHAGGTVVDVNERLASMLGIR